MNKKWWQNFTSLQTRYSTKRLTIPIYTHANTRNLFMNCETDAFMTIALIETYDKMILLLGSFPDYRIVQWPLHLQNWKCFLLLTGMDRQDWWLWWYVYDHTNGSSNDLSMTSHNYDICWYNISLICIFLFCLLFFLSRWKGMIYYLSIRHGNTRQEVVW